MTIEARLGGDELAVPGCFLFLRIAGQNGGIEGANGRSDIQRYRVTESHVELAQAEGNDEAAHENEIAVPSCHR